MTARAGIVTGINPLNNLWIYDTELGGMSVKVFCYTAKQNKAQLKSIMHKVFSGSAKQQL